jgi:hypothetical protein
VRTANAVIGKSTISVDFTNGLVTGTVTDFVDAVYQVNTGNAAAPVSLVRANNSLARTVDITGNVRQGTAGTGATVGSATGTKSSGLNLNSSGTLIGNVTQGGGFAGRNLEREHIEHANKLFHGFAVYRFSGQCRRLDCQW